MSERLDGPPPINTNVAQSSILQQPEVVVDLAPEIPRYSLHTWLNPTTPVTRERLKLCLESIAKRVGGELFAGPFSVDSQGTEGIDKKFLRPGFTPKDWQVMLWWTDKNAQNVQGLPAWTGGIMKHSHGVIYYTNAKGENLIDIFAETCMKFDPEPVYGFLDVFWQPEPKHMQSDFKIITTGTPVDRPPNARKRVGELYTMLTHIGTRNKKEILRDGKRLEQIILHWDEKQDGTLEGYLTLEESIAMREIYALYEGQLEMTTARRIISGDVTDETAFDHYDRYVRLTKEEMKRGGFGKDSKVVFVGGGWLPISAILYARTGAQVTVFEKEKDRALIAERVIVKLGLSGKIKIICKQFEKTILDPFDHFFYVIAAMANPKNEILHNVPDDRTIIARTALRTRNYLYTEINKITLVTLLMPIDYYEAQTLDDVLSFLVLEKIPRYSNYELDKLEYRQFIREMIAAHGNRVYGSLAPNIIKSFHPLP